SHLSSTFIDNIERFLQEALTQSSSVHGVLIDVIGVGVLILGKSGIGKSELALDLVTRGHRLVADDIVDLKRKQGAGVYGSGSDKEFQEKLSKEIAQATVTRGIGDEVE